MTNACVHGEPVGCENHSGSFLLQQLHNHILISHNAAGSHQELGQTRET